MLARQDPERYLDTAFNAAVPDEEVLRQQAERCRRLAKATYDRHTSQVLSAMAESFEKRADELAQKRSG